MDVIAFFDAVTGRRLGRLPASAWSWSQVVSSSGSLDVTVPLSQDTVGMNLRSLTMPWRILLACISSDGTVKHAGPIYKREWDADAKQLLINAGDFLDFLKRRLVLNRSLKTFTGDMIPPDEEGLPAEWRLDLTGTLPGIMIKLLEETLQYGPLPLVLPSAPAGDSVRNYLGADLATVESRLTAISEVLNGPEFRFEPRLADNGARLEFHLLTGVPELVIATHDWDGRQSRTPITGVKVHEDASDQTGDAWAKSGEQADTVIVARTHDMWLETNGCPLLQASDSSHSTVSNLATLTGYTDATVAPRDTSSETISFDVRRTDEAGYALGEALTVGDHVYLRWNDEYIGDTLLGLKVLELSGDEGEWLTASCRGIMDHAL